MTKLKDNMVKLKVLKEMYGVHSPSKFEEGMNKIVIRELDKMGIPYFTFGNTIFNFIPDTPMVSAHLDQVGTVPTSVILTDKKKGTITGDYNIGADDKNGCWIVLNLLKKFPNISFIFSEMEECGGGIKELLKTYKDELEKIKYGLIFDRRGNSDIICHHNDYGVKKLDDDLCTVGADFGYKSSWGVWSDADEISRYMSCANLSCGYYRAHTNNEFTVIKELYNSYNFGIAILGNLKDNYDKPELKTYDWHWRKSSFTNHDYYNNVNNNREDMYSDYYSSYNAKDDFCKVKYCKNCLKRLNNQEIWGGVCITCDTNVTRHFMFHCNVCTEEFIDDEVDLDMLACPICGMQLEQFDDQVYNDPDDDDSIILVCEECGEPLREEDMFNDGGDNLEYHCYFCYSLVLVEDENGEHYNTDGKKIGDYKQNAIHKKNVKKDYNSKKRTVDICNGECPMCKNEITYKDIYIIATTNYIIDCCNHCDATLHSKPSLSHSEIDTSSIIEIHDGKCPDCSYDLLQGGVFTYTQKDATDYLCGNCYELLGTKHTSIDSFIDDEKELKKG